MYAPLFCLFLNFAYCLICLLLAYYRLCRSHSDLLRFIAISEILQIKALQTAVNAGERKACRHLQTAVRESYHERRSHRK